jgi:hypothetical protein
MGGDNNADSRLEDNLVLAEELQKSRQILPDHLECALAPYCIMQFSRWTIDAHNDPCGTGLDDFLNKARPQQQAIRIESRLDTLARTMFHDADECIAQERWFSSQKIYVGNL